MNGPEEFGVAIIGGGRVASAHARAVQSAEGARLIAVAEVDDTRRADAALRFGCEGVADYRSLLDRADVDLVMVGLPHHLHGVAVECLEAGKHAFIEKPMAITLAECDAMIAASKRAGARLMVAHSQQFMPENRAAKAELASGKLGRPVMATDTWYKAFFGEKRPEWFLHNSTGGGMWWMNGAHMIDRLCWFLDTRVKSVRAYVGNAVLDMDTDDSALAFLQFENGVCGTIAHCGYRQGVDTFEAIVTCTEGQIRFGQLGAFVVEDRQWRPLAAQRWDRFALELSEFLDSIREGREAPVTGEYGRHVVAALLACQESSRMGKEIEV